MDLWELSARESIRDLVAAYAHAADSGRFADLLALFTPDAVLEIDSERSYEGRDAILGFLSGTGADLADSSARPLIRHHVSNLHITALARDSARAGSYFLVVTERGLDHWGRYRDEYAVVDGRWLLRRRTVRLDGFTSGSWAAERRERLQRQP